MNCSIGQSGGGDARRHRNSQGAGSIEYRNGMVTQDTPLFTLDEVRGSWAPYKGKGGFANTDSTSCDEAPSNTEIPICLDPYTGLVPVGTHVEVFSQSLAAPDAAFSLVSTDPPLAISTAHLWLDPSTQYRDILKAVGVPGCPANASAGNQRLIRVPSARGQIPIAGTSLNGMYTTAIFGNQAGFVSSACAGYPTATQPANVSGPLPTPPAPHPGVMVPFGSGADMKGPLQFGFEQESASSAIVAYYRLSTIDDSTWLILPISEKLGHFKTSVLRSATAIPMVRLGTAPTYLNELLEAVGSNIWEFRSTPTDDLNSFIAQMEECAWLSGFRHVHVSFPLPTRRNDPLAKLFATYFLISNEYFALRTYAERARSVMHRHMAPAYRGDVLYVWGILDLNQKNEDSYWDLKYKFLGFRTTGLYGNNRVGFDLRARGPLLEEQVHHLTTTVHMLSNPDAPIRLNTDASREQGYSLSTLGGASIFDPIAIGNSVGDHTFNRWSDTVKTMMLEAAKVIKSERRDLYTHLRWSLPLNNWQARPFLQPAMPVIQSATERYVDKVETLARGSAPSQSNAYELSMALHEWAKETQLWTYY